MFYIRTITCKLGFVCDNNETFFGVTRRSEIVRISVGDKNEMG